MRDPSLIIGLYFDELSEIRSYPFDIHLFNHQILDFFPLLDLFLRGHSIPTLRITHGISEIHLDSVLDLVYLIDASLDGLTLHDLLDRVPQLHLVFFNLRCNLGTQLIEQSFVQDVIFHILL